MVSLTIDLRNMTTSFWLITTPFIGSKELNGYTAYRMKPRTTSTCTRSINANVSVTKEMHWYYP